MEIEGKEMSGTYPASDPLVNICEPPENQLSYVKKQQEAGFEVVLWHKTKSPHEMKQQTEEFKFHQHAEWKYSCKCFQNRL